MRYLSILFLSLILLPSTNAQIAAVTIENSFIDVVGESKKEITPDLIYVSVIINEDEVKGSIEENEKKLFSYLEAGNYDIENRVTVSDLNSMVFQHWLKRDKKITTKEYELLAKTEQELELIFLSLRKAEIYNANIDRLQLSNEAEIRNETELEAIKQAQIKARNLAGTIGQKIGKAMIVLDEESTSFQNSYRKSMTAYTTSTVALKGYNSVESFSLDIKKITISAKVYVRFELLPGE
ncbi:MAG TPA: hypothetical protein DEQ34_06845 [Balneolaceae bacterium]|mgnify:CR=1 FL=1|nr:hypothetical protein [Balneolaceae bacterium]|tara:strand:+ start:8393 stop:9106 length:714 start_codon:yes stop_codon:yes gene_type:complete